MSDTPRVILISGDGVGAGKTTLARRFGTVLSLAGALRDELTAIYPNYDWFNRTQEYKELTLVPEWGESATVRQVLIEHGQGKCAADPLHYARILVDRVKRMSGMAGGVVAVDDLRKLIELDHFRAELLDVVHLHLICPSAQPEAHFQNDELRARADYYIAWGADPVSSELEHAESKAGV